MRKNITRRLVSGAIGLGLALVFAYVAALLVFWLQTFTLSEMVLWAKGLFVIGIICVPILGVAAVFAFVIGIIEAFDGY